MIFSELRKFLLELRTSIANKTEINLLLYFVDRIHNLIPNVDKLNDKIDILKLENTQLKKKIKKIEKDRRSLIEDLNIAKMQLEFRMSRHQKLERQIKQLRYGEARRKRRQKKEQERIYKQRNNQNSILDQFSLDQKIIDLDMTQDGSRILRIQDRQAIFTESKYLMLGDSSPYIQDKYLEQCNPKIDQKSQQNEHLECSSEQNIVCTMIDLAANKTRPKILKIQYQ